MKLRQINHLRNRLDIMLIEEQNIIISARDGYPLSAILRTPKNENKGIIQIHSGTGILQELYSNFATYLTEKGYATITFDYRGIGKSRPKSLKGFRATNRDWGQIDMTSIFDWVLENYPDDKKIIVAHSMGGQLIGLMENNDKIDQLFLIGSSTGYWKDMARFLKWKVFFLWYFYIPISNYLFGYAVFKKLNIGEDLPKGVASEWKKWCTNPKYFAAEFHKTLKPLYFDSINIPLRSIQILDDPISNKITSEKLLKYYSNAQITIDYVSKIKLGVNKIGHFGYFSRKFKYTLWNELIDNIEV